MCQEGGEEREEEREEGGQWDRERWVIDSYVHDCDHEYECEYGPRDREEDGDMLNSDTIMSAPLLTRGGSDNLAATAAATAATAVRGSNYADGAGLSVLSSSSSSSSSSDPPPRRLLSCLRLLPTLPQLQHSLQRMIPSQPSGHLLVIK
jgi:hypothetical protein